MELVNEIDEIQGTVFYAKSMIGREDPGHF